MHYSRRQFLQHSASWGVFSVFAVTGLLKPGVAMAQWPHDDFATANLEQTLQTLFHDREIIDSNQITIKAPKTAENGANVPVTIKSDLDNIGKVYLLAEKNPVPLVAEFALSPAVAVYLKARIKMAESSDVIVIADTGEQLLRASRTVKVSVGGCGG
ncbi:thiosulfate oxidation carrier protein SoxY [Methylomarinum vadi]|uniref:thiosulfate oxidation carrier protein SoxY n=1 Tax=Methylomarinum vadi TaxID=438855 RepID=UPI0004DF714F|nr:thiosulfate oxidation carrier protein SoxY [Methylomarinum vadi]